jgi:hypothetical protein
MTVLSNYSGLTHWGRNPGIDRIIMSFSSSNMRVITSQSGTVLHPPNLETGRFTHPLQILLNYRPMCLVMLYLTALAVAQTVACEPYAAAYE